LNAAYTELTRLTDMHNMEKERIEEKRKLEERKVTNDLIYNI